MSLQQKLDEYKAEFLKKAPAAAVATMKKATAELAASNILERVLGIGELAPAFVLNDEQGNRVSSRQLLEEGPLVVTVYRGVW